MTFLVTLPFQTNPDNFDQITVTWDNPSLGVIPFTAYNDGTDSYVTQIYLAALAGDYGPVVSYADSHRWYSTTNGVVVIDPTGTGPQPPNTTLLVPPTPAAGQTVQWNGSAWVLASFDITLPLPEAKFDLLNQTNTDSAAAVVVQLSAYSPVQQATAPDITLLNTLDYPGVNMGTYQTYVDDISAPVIATINSATNISELYPINPAALPFTPESGSSGIISIGRGDGIGGPEDLNLSYLVELNSVYLLTPPQISLFIPGTSTTVAYDSGLPSPYMFNATFGAFNPGDYTLQIRVTATSQVIATIVVPFGANQDISF